MSVKNSSLLERTRALMKRSRLKPRKNLGQNFLIDEDVLALVLETAALSGDETVIEVGPGLGILTGELCARARTVVAVELDDSLAGTVKESLKSRENLVVINRDILKISPADIFKEAGLDPALPYSVVANLPYYITSPVIRHFLEADRRPEKLVVMVQKEVAEEIAAPAGKMSLLSIGMQLYGEAEIAGYVPPSSFYPEPGVESAVLKVTPYRESPVAIDDEAAFFTLVRAGFSVARKQLGNSLSNGLRIEKDQARALLEAADIDPQRRAETLTLEEWARLWKLWEEEKR